MFHTYENLKKFGHRPALIAEDGVTSYSELADAASRFARRLPERRGLVAIEMTPTPATIAAYLGALQAGHAVMPLPVGQGGVCVTGADWVSGNSSSCVVVILRGMGQPPNLVFRVRCCVIA